MKSRTSATMAMLACLGLAFFVSNAEARRDPFTTAPDGSCLIETNGAFGVTLYQLYNKKAEAVGLPFYLANAGATGAVSSFNGKSILAINYDPVSSNATIMVFQVKGQNPPQLVNAVTLPCTSIDAAFLTKKCVMITYQTTVGVGLKVYDTKLDTTLSEVTPAEGAMDIQLYPGYPDVYEVNTLIPAGTPTMWMVQVISYKGKVISTTTSPF